MTERSVKLILAVLTAAAAFCLPGAEERPVFSKIKLKISLTEPPRFRTSSKVSAPGKLNQTNRNWGVIQVDFTPQFGEKGISKSSGLWLDDVTMALQVILIDSGTNKTGYALFDGRCDFWSIALDNRQHSAYMFIAPQLLERYLPSRRSSGTVRAAQVSDFRIRVIFFHKQYGIIGDGYCGFNGTSNAKHHTEFVRLRESVGSRNTLNGALLTRIHTPWGLTDMGNFDLVKPETILPALNEEAIEKAAQEAEEKSRQEAAKVLKESVRRSSATTTSSSSSSSKKKNR